MSVALSPFTLLRRRMRRFKRDTAGASAVEFALIVPIFIALTFALIETCLVFFTEQVLESATQDSGRLIFTSQAQSSGMTEAKFKDFLCDRATTLFTCSDIVIDVRSFAPGAPIVIHNPINAGGAFVNNSVFELPPSGSDNTVVVRAYYQWPLYVTGLGYNIANIGRATASKKRLLAATAAFRPQ